MVDRKSSRTKTFSKNMIYMFCLDHFSVKCIIKNYICSGCDSRGVALKLQKAFLKSGILRHSKGIKPNSFHSTYRHWTGFAVKRKQLRIIPYIMEPINWWVFFKYESCLFWQKKYTIFKKFHKIYF